MMAKLKTMTYVAPESVLLVVEQEGVLCKSTIVGNHGGFDHGGDIEVNMNE